jgi:hypothetical protein
VTTRHSRQPAALGPPLTRSWEGGVIGWIVVFGASIAEIIVGIVTNRMPMVIAAPALALPVAVVAGFVLVQWLQSWAIAAAPASWWHLGGIAAALLIWLVYPTVPPGVLEGAGNARQACSVMQQPVTSDCLRRAAQAMDNHNLAWALTGVVILGAALLARRSRVAAWGAMPAALAGCLLARHFLELLLRFYHAGG